MRVLRKRFLTSIILKIENMQTSENKFEGCQLQKVYICHMCALQKQILEFSGCRLPFRLVADLSVTCASILL